MRLMLELGQRVQLQSMDPHCGDITIGLYERPDAMGRPSFAVHSYAHHNGAGARLAFLARAMAALGGMEAVDGSERRLRWPCGARHLAAVKRLFVEACKLKDDSDLGERPAALADPKVGGKTVIVPHGGGRYEVAVEAAGGDHEARLKAVCAGYLKLAEMERWDERETGVRFECGTPHDALMRLLLYRALNARAALRETEMMASRGILSAPGAQAQAP